MKLSHVHNAYLFFLALKNGICVYLYEKAENKTSKRCILVQEFELEAFFRGNKKVVIMQNESVYDADV